MVTCTLPLPNASWKAFVLSFWPVGSPPKSSTLTIRCIFLVKSALSSSLALLSLKKSWYRRWCKESKLWASIDVWLAFNSLLPSPLWPNTRCSISSSWKFSWLDKTTSWPFVVLCLICSVVCAFFWVVKCSLKLSSLLLVQYFICSKLFSSWLTNFWLKYEWSFVIKLSNFKVFDLLSHKNRKSF